LIGPYGEEEGGLSEWQLVLTDCIIAFTSNGKAFNWDWPVGDFPFDYFDRPVPPDVVFTEDIDGGYDLSAALRLP
jgi:hypothetical protein